MKVKIFDEGHEKDLEEAVNAFLASGNMEVIDIKYQVSICEYAEDQLYCFSAMVVYYAKE